MATPNIIPPDALDYIAQNSAMTADELRVIIREKWNVDVSRVAITLHLRKARTLAEARTAHADAEISRKVAQRVATQIDPILQAMEEQLQVQLQVLRGEHPHVRLNRRGKNGELLDDWDNRSWNSTEKLFYESAKTYLNLRPPAQVIEINSKDDVQQLEELLQDGHLTEEDIVAMISLQEKVERAKKEAHDASDKE